MNFLKLFKSFFFDQFMLGFGGGGGGGTPTQSTAYQTNVPEYAKPYVTNMLEATTQQLFNTTPGADGVTQITSPKEYKPYSTDPTAYFAGPTGMQQQAYNAAGQLQTPSQFGDATQLASVAGLGALGAQRQGQMLGRQALGYGAQGAGYGAMGAGIGALGMGQAAPAFSAGQQYANQMTDPNAVASYMSPYQQAVTDVAKNAAVREAQIAQQSQNLAAARQGTYGGARQALAQSERERNLLSNLSNIQAQGSQSAYDKAVQAQQFGANLGLQGIQTGLQGVQAGMQGTAQGMQGAQSGMQGVQGAIGAGQYGLQGLGQATQAAGTLGSLGGQELQAAQSNINLQNQLGAAQQAYQQNIINQQIQDYATAQQYPLMQLGFMSNMLRGLPMQATTTQSYQAQPTTATQLISGLGTAAGAYKAFGAKEGGVIKMAGGGVAAERSQAAANIRAQLEAMPPEQVAQVAQSSSSQEVRKLANEVLIEKRIEMQAEQQAKQSVAGDMARGLPAAPAPSMDTINAASGGIIAFADGGETDYDLNKRETDPYRVLTDAEYIARDKARRTAMGISDTVSPRTQELLEKRIADMPKARERAAGESMMEFFSKMNRPGSLLKAATDAAGETLPGITARRKELETSEFSAIKGIEDINNVLRAEKLGTLKMSDDQRDKILSRKADLEKVKMQVEGQIRAAGIGAGRASDLDKTTDAIFNALVAQGADPKDPTVRAQARREALSATGLTGAKFDLAVTEKFNKAVSDDPMIGEKGSLTQQLKMLNLNPTKNADQIAAVNEKIATRKRELAGDFNVGGGSTSGGSTKKQTTSTGEGVKPDISKIAGAPSGSSIGAKTANGWEIKDKNGKVVGYAQ